MSSRVSKDLRNLLPEWIITLVLVVAPLLCSTVTNSGSLYYLYLAFFFLAVGCSWLGTGILGKDLALGILSVSLAQPQSRRRLWKEKSVTLCLQIGSVFCAYLSGLVWMTMATGFPWETSGAFALSGLLLAVTSFGAGRYFTLFLRSYQGAFWLTLISPLAIAALLMLAALPFRGVAEVYLWFIGLVILVFGVMLGVRARKRFQVWEDLGPWGGDIWLRLKREKSIGISAVNSRRRHRPIWRLIRKELSLQQLNFIVTVVVLVFYAIVIAPYNFWLQGPELAGWGAFPRILLLVMIPMAVGAVAISEERRIGTLQWQQIQPASRFLQ